MTEKHRLSAIRRTVRLIHGLQRGTPYNVTTAAALLGVQEPAAKRQLKAIEIELHGAVSSSIEDRRRVWRCVTTAKRAARHEAQVISTCLGASLAPLFEGSDYAGPMRDGRREIAKLARREERFADADRKFWFVPRGGEIALPNNAGFLDDIINALLGLKELDVRYLRFDGRKDALRLQPLSLAIYDHQLYLIAQRPGTSERHPYRFSRFVHIDDTQVPFTYPTRSSYDPAVVLGHSFGIHVNQGQPAVDVVVRLQPRWATYAQHHRWHRSQEITNHSTYVEVRMQVRICEELKAWIRGFGLDATVTKPKSLRDEILRTSVVTEAASSQRTKTPRQNR